MIFQSKLISISTLICQTIILAYQTSRDGNLSLKTVVNSMVREGKQFLPSLVTAVALFV
jgi:hypothetical protein